MTGASLASTGLPEKQMDNERFMGSQLLLSLKAVIHGKEVCLVFTGGESRPLLEGSWLLIPETEKIGPFPWRSSKYESANAVPPFPRRNEVFFPNATKRAESFGVRQNFLLRSYGPMKP